MEPGGSALSGFSDFIRKTVREAGFERILFWGVVEDEKGRPSPPVWLLERTELFQEGTRDVSARKTTGDIKPTRILSRWVKEEIQKDDPRTVFVIHYIDKLTPYSARGIYPQETMNTILLIQKIIENLAESNRLIMVALQDTMVPLEYYTNSPRTGVLHIPMPDKDERRFYFESYLAAYSFSREHMDLMANITEGLYLRDIENIVRDVLEETKGLEEVSSGLLKKLVNRYRLGTEDDPWEKLPLTTPINVKEGKGLLDAAESWFLKRVKGQDHAVREVVRVIKKARSGLTGIASGQTSKPRGVFFFAGPTGVGKTFLAKKLAEFLFDTEEAFFRFDMSEFKEEHTVSKLIGAPPGYVGYEQGGMLTNSVRNRPFSVILFDEMEKAHPKIMDIFLQILDDGRLTDSRGQTVFFTESVIIFTSNIGTRSTDSRGKEVLEKANLDSLLDNPGLSEGEREMRIRDHFLSCVQDFFMYEISRPELLNRFGSNIIPFNHIRDEAVQKEIFMSKLKEIEEGFRDKFTREGFRLQFADRVVGYFVSRYGEKIKRFGGRGLVNAIEDEIISTLADQVLWAEKNGQTNLQFEIGVEGERIVCRRLQAGITSDIDIKHGIETI